MRKINLLEGEEILFSSKTGDFIITTDRIRSISESILGNEFKSILLEELSSCEIKTTISWSILTKAIVYPLLINGSAFLINNYLFKSSLLELFFDKVQIGSEALLFLFYFSLIIGSIYLLKFLFSIRKMILFYAPGLTIEYQSRKLDYDKKVDIIDRVESARLKKVSTTKTLDN
ncbi:MAG: hypothetical protein HKN92_03600 [Chitinophagales bacterium]|nr:hypothetical protein [Chitinophagales bacterium]